MTTTSNVFVYLGLPSSLAPRGVDQGLEGGGVRPRQLDELLPQSRVRVRARRSAAGAAAPAATAGGRSKGVCGGDRGALRMPMADRRARIESTATVDSRTISPSAARPLLRGDRRWGGAAASLRRRGRPRGHVQDFAVARDVTYARFRRERRTAHGVQQVQALGLRRIT